MGIMIPIRAKGGTVEGGGPARFGGGMGQAGVVGVGRVATGGRHGVVMARGLRGGVHR
jgi:hypothetical protein